jgi:hypothetical protein
MVLTNDARGLIITELESLFVNGGIGLDDTTPTKSDTGLFGGGVSIDDCDSSTGWTHGGDGNAETENTTSGEYKEGDGCLNLPTTHSGGTAYWYKTVTSVDLEDKKVALWYYIDNVSDLADSTDSVRVDLGTGGFTNYNSYYFDRDSLSSGWNGLLVSTDTVDNSSGTGADLTDVDRIRLFVRADQTQGSNDMRMDDWRYYESGTLGITESQSALNVTTGDYYIKTIHSVAVTEANGLVIVESGDTDGSTLLSRQTFAEVNKGSNTSLQIDKFYYLD